MVGSKEPKTHAENVILVVVRTERQDPITS